MEEDGWREGRSEDKCALSFLSERNLLLKGTYLHRQKLTGNNRLVFILIKKISGGSWTPGCQKNSAHQLTSIFWLDERSFSEQESLICKDALRSEEG